jgi:hypothetical protein
MYRLSPTVVMPDRPEMFVSVTLLFVRAAIFVVSGG